MIQSNMGFMSDAPRRCEVCGGDDCANYALSELRIDFGYGSRYDGERLELAICGDCAERIYNLIQESEVDSILNGN